MKLNDTAPILAPAGGPPPWLGKLAEDATLEATVLKRPIEGRADILAVLKHAIPLYEFQDFTYKGRSAAASSWNPTVRKFAAFPSNVSCLST